MSITKTVNVTNGKVIHYTIKKTGYKTVSGSKLITANANINIDMVSSSSSSGPYTFGDRIGGCATFYTYFDSINPDTQASQKYAVFVLDAAYRRASVQWGPSADTLLPTRGNAASALAAKESATYNTSVIFDNYAPSSSSYQAFYYARNPGGQSLIINVDGINYTPQLPNIHELNVMYSYKDQLDALDPTLIDGTGDINLFSTNSEPWSSTEQGYSSAWRFYTRVSDHIGSATKTNYTNMYIYPVFEIPVN